MLSASKPVVYYSTEKMNFLYQRNVSTRTQMKVMNPLAFFPCVLFFAFFSSKYCLQRVARVYSLNRQIFIADKSHVRHNASTISHYEPCDNSMWSNDTAMAQKVHVPDHIITLGHQPSLSSIKRIRWNQINPQRVPPSRSYCECRSVGRHILSTPNLYYTMSSFSRCFESSLGWTYICCY